MKIAGFAQIALVAIFFGPNIVFADCNLPGPASGIPSGEKRKINLYVQGEVDIAPPAWLMSRGFYVSPEESIVNECSTFLSAETISDSLPERLNIFAHLPEESRSTAFVAVSSVDQKMAMEKTGPYWHAYVMAFPDLRFIAATVRLAYGLVTLDESIRSPADLANKRVGLVLRPSSLRALQEIVLIRAWDIYDQITVKEYLPFDLAPALSGEEIDAAFMPVVRITDRGLQPLGIDLSDSSLRWISISEEDVLAATDKTPVLAERVVFSHRTGTSDGDNEVGLITFDAAWFTFASTPDDVVYEFINAAKQVCPPQVPSCNGRSFESMMRWPQLEANLIHPGALKFYQENGADFSR